jgi:TPR repeat protein
LGKKDLAKAYGYFRQACEGGSPSGCNQVGRALAEGLGVKKDLDGAMRTWAKACKARNAAACANLGRAFKAKGDDDNARKASTRACHLGDDEACKEKGLPPPDLEE